MIQLKRDIILYLLLFSGNSCQNLITESKTNDVTMDEGIGEKQSLAIPATSTDHRMFT